MTTEEFKDIVNLVGADNILALHFNNSACHVFHDDDKFSLEKYLIEDKNFLKLPIRAQVPFYVYKHVETVEAVIVKHEVYPFTAYDTLTITP